jgi:hypothetical protein
LDGSFSKDASPFDKKKSQQMIAFIKIPLVQNEKFLLNDTFGKSAPNEYIYSVVESNLKKKKLAYASFHVILFIYSHFKTNQ